MDFEGKVIAVFNNVLKQNRKNLIILDQSCFYPTSGGQQHDTGKMTIEGLGDFEVLDVTKVGKSVLHLVDKDIPDDLDIVGRKVVGQVNLERRL
jgi:Ser-tRNA(Ala) deacylase AlaX